MQKNVQINAYDINLFVTARGKSVSVDVTISKPADGDAIADDTVSLIIEAKGGRLLSATEWPDPGALPETVTVGATAHAHFGFSNPDEKSLKRAIFVLRGEFAEVALDG